MQRKNSAKNAWGKTSPSCHDRRDGLEVGQPDNEECLILDAEEGTAAANPDNLDTVERSLQPSHSKYALVVVALMLVAFVGGVVVKFGGPSGGDSLSIKQQRNNYKDTKWPQPQLATKYGQNSTSPHQPGEVILHPGKQEHRELGGSFCVPCAAGTYCNLQGNCVPVFNIKMDKHGQAAQDDDFILTFNGNGNPATVGAHPLDGFTASTKFVWGSGFDAMLIQFQGTAATPTQSCLTETTNGAVAFETCGGWNPVQQWEPFQDCNGANVNIRNYASGRCLSANNDGTISVADCQSSLQTRWYLTGSPDIAQVSQCSPVSSAGRDPGLALSGVDDFKIYHRYGISYLELTQLGHGTALYRSQGENCPAGQVCRFTIPHNKLPSYSGVFILSFLMNSPQCQGCSDSFEFEIAPANPSYCLPPKTCHGNNGCQPGYHCNIQGTCTNTFNIKLDRQGVEDDDKYLLTNTATFGSNPLDSFSKDTQFIWKNGHIQSTNYNPPSCLTALADGSVRFFPCSMTTDPLQQWKTFVDCVDNTNIQNVALGKCLSANSVDKTVSLAACGPAETKWYLKGSPAPLLSSEILPDFGTYDTKIYFNGLVETRLTPIGKANNILFEGSQQCTSGFCKITIPQSQYYNQAGQYLLWNRLPNKNTLVPWVVQKFDAYPTSHYRCPVPSTPPPTPRPTSAPTILVPTISPTSAPIILVPTTSPTSAPTPKQNPTYHNVDSKICQSNGATLTESVYGVGAVLYITKDFNCPNAINTQNMLTILGHITFDGRGHTIQAAPSSPGVWTYGVSVGQGASIKNVKLDKFSKGGMLVSAGTVTLHNVTLTNSLAGLELDLNALQVTISKDVTISNNDVGVLTVGSNNANHKYTAVNLKAPLVSCFNTQHDLDLYDSYQIQSSSQSCTGSCELHANNIFWLGGSSFNHNLVHQPCP